MLLCIFGAPVQAEPPPAESEATPDILILSSYAPGYNWSDSQLTGVISALKRAYPQVEPVIQYLDFKRFMDPKREAWLLADIEDKCVQHPPKLIITIDDPAFYLCLKYRRRISPSQVPVVFCGLNYYDPKVLHDQPDVTGVVEETDHSGTFDLIERLMPDARRIIVISNKTKSGLESTRTMMDLIPKYSKRYQFEILDTWTNEQLFDRMRSMPPGTVGFLMEGTTDANGTTNYNNPEFSRILATESSQPIFIKALPSNIVWQPTDHWDGFGGGVLDPELHGQTAGEIALRVLRGEKAGGIPILTKSPEKVVVDYRQMVRFGLSMDRLPMDAAVHYRPESFYRFDKWEIIMALAVFSLVCAAVVLLSVNIIARKRAEKALHRAMSELHASQKMEAIGLLAGGIAHDFNNLLQVIRGHSALMLDEPASLGANHESVSEINEAAKRAAQLTQQLLAFSRKQTTKSEPQDPDQLVADMLKMIKRLIGEHIEISFTPLDTPCYVLFDRGQFEQILLNLCVNARDAMSTGGRLSIAHRIRQLEAEDIDVNDGLKPGPHLEITVQDNECGMTPEVIRRIFEPYFTTKPQGHGTGLGLSVVYGIVKQHKGHIRVYSEQGTGSAFRLLFPILPSDTVMTLKESSASPEQKRGWGSLLLAEDDPQVQKLTQRLLKRNGFDVVVVTDGQMAIDVLNAQHSRLRLVILDVMMPKQSGRQVYDHIKANYPKIPVLFCSGYSSEMLPSDLAPETGAAMITKPYSSSELLQRVHQMLDSRPDGLGQ